MTPDTALPPAQVARDITYASSARTALGRGMIRVMENATGRLGLIRRAQGYDQELSAGQDFWQVMCRRYGVEPQFDGAPLSVLTGEGPLVVVANHPFGVLDGVMMGRVLSQARGADGFRIMAHRVFRAAPDIEGNILPVSFDGTLSATRDNLTMRAEALAFLRQGGAVGIFPGGTVSTSARPFGVPADPGWRRFTAKMVARSGARVVPLYFHGANSRLFQIASHMHPTLRMGLLLREFRRRVDRPVRITLGAPIDADALRQRHSDPQGMMDLLRAATYDLSGDPDAATRFGYEFEAKHRGRDGSRNF